MSKANFNFESLSITQNSYENLTEFEEILQSIDDASTISFELLLPKKRLIDTHDILTPLDDNIYSVEELYMRQNLVDIALKENLVLKESPNDYVDLIVKNDSNMYANDFIKNLDKMTKDDVEFFDLLASHQKIAINNSQSIIIKSDDGNSQVRYVKFSKSLQNLISYALESGAPIRIDFAKNLTIILQINKMGEISAEFISREKAMEAILKNNLPLLRKKLDNSGIKYKKIEYKKYSNQKENE